MSKTPEDTSAPNPSNNVPSQNQTPSQTNQERINSADLADAQKREKIAMWVLIASIVTIALVSVMVVVTAKEGENRERASQRVMDSTLPLYGTWVGTILAFYFSRNAFEAASSATARNAAVFQQVSNSPSLPPENKLNKILVSSLKNNLIFSQNDLTKSLSQVVKDLKDKDRYRVIVVDKDNKYISVIRRYEAEAYLTMPKSESSQPSTDKTNENSQPSGDHPVATTLDEYIKWQKDNKQQHIVVFLPESATLADADAKIRETKGCKDVIVTTDGKDSSPVTVYITDSDINEYR